jgi:hypothetical protein
MSGFPLHARFIFLQDEPVILTHDEHEFLAGPNGNRIIDAVQNKNLAAVSTVLCKEMALYGQIHDDLNIHERPSDKLYDILKTQVSALKAVNLDEERSPSADLFAV